MVWDDRLHACQHPAKLLFALRWASRALQCFVQDLFAGAWQQADPAIDQVPYTFPPVHGPAKMGKGKKSKKGVFKGKGKAHKNGGQAARGMEEGQGFIEHPQKLLPCPPKPPRARDQWVLPEPMPRRGVSATDYAAALDQEL